MDLTVLTLTKSGEDNINCEINVTDGDIHLMRKRFYNKLINFCIKQFCKQNSYKEEDIKRDKNSCKRLKMKCNNSKKKLNIYKETIIIVDNFYGNEDLSVKITRDFFDDLSKDLYVRIEELIKGLLNVIGIKLYEIDEIILVGRGTRIIGVKNFIGKLFGLYKIKDYLNFEETFSLGVNLEAGKMEEKIE